MFASFMPKPLPDKCGSGLHIYLSCQKNGKNIFSSKTELPREARKMIGGILDSILPLTMFFNGTANSYSRLGEHLAPKYVTWTHMNYSQLIRAAVSASENNGIVLRSPDCTCNPYFAFGLLIYACLDGIANDTEPDEASDFDLHYADAQTLGKLKTLPADLNTAAEYAENSGFLKDRLPEGLLDFLVMEKKTMWAEYCEAQDKEIYESVKYFYTL